MDRLNETHPKSQAILGTPVTQHCHTRHTCHRCGEIAARRGRLSASVQLDSGRTVRCYTCARCVNEIGGGSAALIRHANIFEQANLARVIPFKPSGAHRGADRRAA
jgi:ribosomal protein S27E